MGQGSSTPPSPPPVVEEKKKLKICCACPETRKARDECLALHGEDRCADLIEAHKQCLRKEGFNI